MDRETFKAAWHKARAERFKGSQSIGALYFSPALGAAFRQEVEPLRTYWALLSQNIDRTARGHGEASKGDRAFYVARARAIRRAKFRNNWPDVPRPRLTFPATDHPKG